MDAWLANAADALAGATDVPRATLSLDDEAAVALLDLARLAAHESGDRRNAPLLCYLLGLAAGSGKTLDELAGAVTRSTS